MGDLGAGVGGWIDRNIALDLRGGPNHVGNSCDAPVLVDTGARTVIQQPSFHSIAHFSKDVKPGAYRVAPDGRVDSLQALAFSNRDGTVAIVAFNPGDAPDRFNLALAAERKGCQIPAHAMHAYLVKG